VRQVLVGQLIELVQVAVKLQLVHS
jgi:hypothetical protein